MRKRLLTPWLVIVLLAGCAEKTSETEAAANAVDLELKDAAPGIGAWGVDLSGRDLSVKPGDDFFRYASGAWLQAFELPADQTRYNSFTKLSLEAEGDIREIVEELAASTGEPGSIEQKVGDYFNAWMDVAALNDMGAAPLKPHLEAIAGISSNEDLMRAFASIHYSAPISISISINPLDPATYIVRVGQSGTGLPDRDYYISDNERSVSVRNAYKDYIASMLMLAAIEAPHAKADAIIALEARLAETHWTRTQTRDVTKTLNTMSLEQLNELAPAFDWPVILAERNLPDVNTFIVSQTTAIAAAGKIVADTPIDVWKDYLAYHFISRHAQYLSTDFDRANWTFFNKTLNGAEQQRDRWKRGVSQVNGWLGEAVGRIYVARHFPPSGKVQMEEMVGNLLAAFEERLRQNSWMDEITRQQALLKLSKIEPQIAYTSEWKEYVGLEIKPGRLLENVLTMRAFFWNEQVRQLGGPVNRQEWFIPPQTVDAYYSSVLNQIIFPAGILQAPFFDPNADPAVNYGGIGGMIGHEIGHGFDDRGRRFDERGRFRNWWSDEANDAFQVRAGALGRQYDQYSPVEGMTVNGQLTMGENIGDLGGMQMAYAAYRRYVDDYHNGEAPVIDGLTGDQRFFLAWAQIWRTKIREEALRRRLLTDSHSPAEYRVNGVVRNMDAWYDAFNVEPGDALYLPPEDRVRIW